MVLLIFFKASDRATLLIGKSVGDFFRTKGFTRIFDGFFLKTKGFLPKVYDVFGSEMPLADTSSRTSFHKSKNTVIPKIMMISQMFYLELWQTTCSNIRSIQSKE